MVNKLSRLSPSTSVWEAYQDGCKQGHWYFDQDQANVLQKLDQLAQALQKQKGKKTNISWLLPYWRSNKIADAPKNVRRGAYIYGSVGRGKTMVMDLFFRHVEIKAKKRIHFHTFMTEIHEGLWRLKKNDQHQSHGTDGWLAILATQIAQEAQLICLDEFHVNNIADAMILGRLFSELMKNQVVLVITSNWAPRDLYQNGLQRVRFLPFIDMIEQEMDILFLGGVQDYRQQTIPTDWRYLYPITQNNQQKIQHIFEKLSGGKPITSTIITVQGRSLVFSKTASNVLLCFFDELCQRNLGKADYLAIARHFRYIIVQNVPKFTPDLIEALHRFIHLIDILYDERCYLMILAATDVPDLYFESNALQIGFTRTLSRLHEMRSINYQSRQAD